MDRLPAIDLRDGKCVRLIQGDYHRQITYQHDPVATAGQFADAGAEWLHIVDLDGAKIGKPVNAGTIADILALGRLKVEVGGGIRNEDTIKKLLELGCSRVIIGTKAVSDFDWFARMADKYPDKLALGLDARGSRVATDGWTRDNPQPLLEFAADADKLPLSAIIYTDIAKDGMMSGPNLKRTRKLAESVDTPVIASGGVHSLEDIRNCARISVEGTIIGRALYEKTLDLAEAVKLAAEF